MALGTLITWTLTGENLVTGKVTGFEYENLPGATVTVTNLRTNEDATATVEEDGTYAVDLGDTSAGAFPSGYDTGDEIQISCTHRDATRVWKRRVAGSEIEQDIHFTHGTWLGALKKAQLVVTDNFTSPSGTSVTLRDADTGDVLEVSINGDELDETAWTFVRPQTVNLPSQLSSSDVVEVTRTIHRRTDQAKTEVLNEGDAAVRDATARYYTSPLPSRCPELQNISELLAAAALRERIWSGADKPDQTAREYRKTANELLEEIRNGKKSLTDQDGAYITPTAKSTTTPQSSLTPTRRFTRFTDDNAKVSL